MAISLALTEPPSLAAPAAAAAFALRSSTAVATTPLARSAATAAGRLSASISPLTAAATERPLYAKTAIAPLLRRQRDAQYFLHRGGALQHFQEAGLAQSLHSLALGHFPDLRCLGTLEDDRAEILGDRHHLVERDPTLHAREVTGLAAFALEERHPTPALGDVSIGHQVVFVALDGLLAILADPPTQALGQDEQQRRGQQERLHAHIHEPGDGRWTIVGVQRGEDEVAGESGANADLRRLEIARLADEDDVGVLPQEGAQHSGEGTADTFVDLDLVHPFEVVLDRVLGGHDVVLGRVDRRDG